MSNTRIARGGVRGQLSELAVRSGIATRKKTPEEVANLLKVFSADNVASIMLLSIKLGVAVICEAIAEPGQLKIWGSTGEDLVNP